jgi:ubiquinone/menaquinone biosynthesis C-methylase UbiE
MPTDITNRYGSLSAWAYDLDKPIGHSFGDIEFLLGRLKDCPGPILEPCVGTGRVLIRLLEAGHDAEGFDASNEMLEICRRNCQSRGLTPRLSQMRWESFQYDRKFAAIVMTAATIELIPEFDTACAVLRRFHDHLQPGGRLILDISPDDSFTSDPEIRSWTTSDGDLVTLLELPTKLDYVMQRSHTPFRYEHWREGKLVQSELEILTLRWWGMHEMAMAMTSAGFAPPIISGGFEHGRAPRTGDNVISFEAVRR